MSFDWFTRGVQKPLGLPVAYEVSVGAVICRQSKDGWEYLLLQYPYGYWDYVKGHVEKGENHAETLARETEEEAGIRLKKTFSGFHWKSCYAYKAKGRERERRMSEGRGVWILKTVHFYLAEAEEGTVRISHEHIGSAWFSFEQAVERLAFPRSKEILSEANKTLLSL